MKVMESHGKAICLQKIERQKDKKFEKVTDESKAGFNCSRNKTSTYFMHVMLKNILLKIVLILPSKQMLKLWSWKTRKGHGEGHEKPWNLKIVKEYEP